MYLMNHFSCEESHRLSPANIGKFLDKRDSELITFKNQGRAVDYGFVLLVLLETRR